MRRTLTMRSFWFDPYLWVHLAGLATVPLWLEICLLGLAVGDPILPSWLELFLVGTIGVAPILWMQWQRPFNIFSLLVLALKPENLTEDQRRLLTLFQAQRNRFLAVGAAIVALFILRQIYYIAPVATATTPFGSSGRLVGLLIAAIAFLGANLFLQVPVAVLSVLGTSESVFAATLPYPTDQIGPSFTFLGFPVNQVLPPLTIDKTPKAATVSTSPAPNSIATEAISTHPDAVDLAEDPWFGAEDAVGSPNDTVTLTETVTPPEMASEATEVPPQPDEKLNTESIEIASEEVTTKEEIAPSADSDPTNSL